ncbi:MAG TPA: ATP-dependent Clp protease proteolytic subunit [Syntrophales bacterium]|nr:ATP-dependent Clp protease proteolytic subunit [Syntrophales bacterium]
MYNERLPLYKKIEKLRKSKVLLYVTGDRRNLETKIHSEVADFFADHLDTFRLPKKISLILYSRGGDTLAGWMIVNMIRLFCEEFEVIIPSKAHSTATLICLGADKIVMTKQATLGPIDPSITTPLNPQVPGAPPMVRLPISVEAVASYFELAKNKKLMGLKEESNLTNVFLKLADQVHPLALGDVYRARTQIQMLAERLLNLHMKGNGNIKKIISVLCSESGSHDYTINRREAAGDLNLPVEIPDNKFYKIIKDIHTDVRLELKLNESFEPDFELGVLPSKPYSATRALIESTTGGSHKYSTEGVLTRIQIPSPAGQQPGVQVQGTFEGWRHEEIC